jgi:hypothetical protein
MDARVQHPFGIRFSRCSSSQSSGRGPRRQDKHDGAWHEFHGRQSAPRHTSEPMGTRPSVWGLLCRCGSAACDADCAQPHLHAETQSCPCDRHSHCQLHPVAVRATPNINAAQYAQRTLGTRLITVELQACQGPSLPATRVPVQAARRPSAPASCPLRWATMQVFRCAFPRRCVAASASLPRSTAFLRRAPAPRARAV